MNIKDIKKLMELLSASDLAEIEVTDDKKSIRLSRPSSQAPIVNAAPALQPIVTPAAITAPTPAAQISENSTTTTASGHQVKSPMVGTFYGAPSPDSDPYVSVGQSVSIGETLCIIEAMKIMNPIEADKTGTIKQILVEDGAPVEFDQPLFVIE